MRYLLWAVGTVTTLAMFGMFIAAIWLEDARWGITGFTLMWLAFAAFAVSSFVPAPARKRA